MNPINGSFQGFAPAASFNEEGQVVDEFKDLFAGFSPVLLWFATISLVIYMLIGIPGNLFTIIALARCKKVSWRGRQLLSRLSSKNAERVRDVNKFEIFLRY